MSVTVPTAVREAIIEDGGDPEWFDTIPALAATRRGLAHGDLNPGNILRSLDPSTDGGDPSAGWLAIDPKPVHGDLAWDPWPLLTQVGAWTVVIPDPAVLAQRIGLVAGLSGLDAARIGAWCVARGVESGLWAASLDRWTGFRGAACDWPGPAAGRRRRICSTDDAQLGRSQQSAAVIIASMPVDRVGSWTGA